MTAKIDGRRRSWFACSVDILHSATGTKLQDELGPAAVACWIGLLAAAKRSPNEGRLSFSSEAEAWQLIGITRPEDLGFTFEDLLKTLGTQKQTRKTRRGRVTNVVVTHWEDWQTSRSGPRNTREMRTKSERVVAPDKDIDIDRDNGHRQDISPARAPNQVWDAFSFLFGEPSNPKAAKRRGGNVHPVLQSLAVTTNREIGDVRVDPATYDEVLRRARLWPFHFGSATLTEEALAKHWDTLGRHPVKASESQAKTLTRRAELEALEL
jgi:hypothetical protein